MDIINYTDLRNGLKDAMERVCANHTPLAITRKGGEPVVMMSLADFNAEQETGYLLRSEQNRKRLTKALVDITKGNFTERDLIEE